MSSSSATRERIRRGGGAGEAAGDGEQRDEERREQAEDDAPALLLLRHHIGLAVGSRAADLSLACLALSSIFSSASLDPGCCLLMGASAHSGRFYLYTEEANKACWRGVAWGRRAGGTHDLP